MKRSHRRFWQASAAVLTYVLALIGLAYALVFFGVAPDGRRAREAAVCNDCANAAVDVLCGQWLCQTYGEHCSGDDR